MKIFFPLPLIVTLLSTNWLSAHCQVPCGVYGDSARFTQMLEDQTTIAKAIAQINDPVSYTHLTLPTNREV